MAAKYAIGAGVNYNDDTSWSTTDGGSNDTTKPTAADDVFLTSNSGNMTINSAAVCRSINCTGYTGILTHNSGTALTIGDGTAGASNIALKFVSGMTYTLGSVNTSTIAFVSTSATQQTIDFAGKSCGPTSWNATSNGSWILSSAFSCSSTNTACDHTKGTLNTGNQSMTFAYIFRSTNSNTRTLTLGSSTIICQGGSVTSFNCSNSTGLTLTANTATITLSGATSGFDGGGKTFGGTLNLTGTGTVSIGSGIINAVSRVGGNLSITGDTTITNLTYQNEAAARTLTITATKTLTSTAAGFLVNGSSGKLISIVSSSGGSAGIISVPSGTVSCDYLSLTDSTATGGASFYAGANSNNVSGNTNWIFTAPPVGTTIFGDEGMVS